MRAMLQAREVVLYFINMIYESPAPAIHEGMADMDNI